MGVYHVVQTGYRKLLPRPVRDFLAMSPLTRGPHRWMLQLMQKKASHNDLYDKSYYENVVDPSSRISAGVIAESLMAAVGPKSVVDVGCGTGQMLLAFQRAGVAVRGLEYSKAALEMCRERGLAVEPFNIEDQKALDWKADLVISTEVAEHLPQKFADHFVDLLCGIAGNIFITAAVPGSPGTDHSNEQPNSYWIAKFVQRGYTYEEALSLDWRRRWQEQGVSIWYCQSAMLFRRGS
jgi:SAM-dependent methyltransferase